MTVTVTGVITLAPPAPTSPRRGNTPARAFQPDSAVRPFRGRNVTAARVADADQPLPAPPGLPAGGQASEAGTGAREGALSPTNPRTHRGLRAGAPTSAGVPEAEARAGRAPPRLRSAAAAAAPRGRGRAPGLGRPHSPTRVAWSGAWSSSAVCEVGGPGGPFYGRRY